MKYSWKGYWKPTPKSMRKAADSILAGAMTVATFSFMIDYKGLSLAIMIIAGVSKILSNFFTNENEDNG
jgi:ABC-type transport system involved in cytochrome c biogenesis permease subunit